MADRSPKILVTGATGQLGRLVIDRLVQARGADRLAALVRSEEAAAALSPRGVEAFVGDYSQPETLEAPLRGVDRLLLISSNEIGRRAAQHHNVIEAARQAGVGFLAYTSVLHADSSPLALADEHRLTEAEIRASAIPYALLRNGWYTENRTASIASILDQGVILGAAGEGRFSTATRADFAEAAAAVLLAETAAPGRIYELAGDAAHTLAELAGEISRQSGRTVAYKDLSEADFKAALVGAGLPEAFAGLLADSDAAASKGAVFDDGRELSRLIGRPTTPLSDTVSEALRGSIAA